MRRGVLIPGLALACTLAAQNDATAYTIQSIVTHGCHEDITMEALRLARRDTPAARPLAPVTRDDRALLRDLPYDVDADMRDLGAAALVLGARDIDLHGVDPADLLALTELYFADRRQPEHCLRQRSHDEPSGDAQALAACRSFILGEIEAALEGLSPDGRVLVERRTRRELSLAIRGQVEVELPLFYFRLGHALHTLEDAFSHHYRTSDHLRVVAVTNYIDPEENGYDPARDGPPHATELDECTDLDEFRRERREVATGAAVALIQALLDPAENRAEREARAETVLERYLTLEPGCTYDNDWCEAPEADYDTPACGCALPGRARSSRWPLLAGALLLAAAAVRRRARVPVSLALCSFALVRPAAAAEPTSREPPEPAPTPSRPPAPPAASSRLGLELAAGFSPKSPAFAGSLGGRYRLDEHLLVGADVELNPWFSGTTRDVRAGALNVYATSVARFPLRNERVHVRATLSVGASRALFDLVGVPEGSTGLFLGGTPLGLDVRLGRGLLLVMNPGHIAMAAPKLTGLPLAYVQYRFTVGLQLGAS